MEGREEGKKEGREAGREGGKRERKDQIKRLNIYKKSKCIALSSANSSQWTLSTMA